ncbi:MAG: ribonuclease III [Proteobacteria bacterium]|nr:ribonuclease III [Pseudomonadota bacterium]
MRERLGYTPHDLGLFRAALTHRSAGSANNERLEFLGDAVVNMVAAHQLFAAFPRAAEGDLSRLRARLVSREPLAQIAAELDVGAALQLGAGELRSGGFRRQSILSDALEALFGAVYLDGGLAAAKPLIERLLAPRLAALPAAAELKDAKTRLQEYLQGRDLARPLYVVRAVEGEDHAQVFHVSCRIEALQVQTRGHGASRRRAEQEAAAAALAQIEARHAQAGS